MELTETSERAPRRKRLIVEVERGTDPVTGRIREGGRTDRRFSGWLELAAALGDALRGDVKPERAGEPLREPSRRPCS